MSPEAKTRKRERDRARNKDKMLRRRLRDYFPYLHSSSHKVLNNRELAKRLALIPKDTRDITGKHFGDPIKNDPRRPWLHTKNFRDM